MMMILKSSEYELWLKAMKSKMDSMYDNQVWNLVNAPERIKLNGCRWIFKERSTWKVMRLPIRHALAVLKSIRIASMSWNIHETIKEFGFSDNMNEPCVYKKVSGSVVIFLM